MRVSQGAEQGDNLMLKVRIQWVRTLVDALNCLGTACAVEVPLGMSSRLLMSLFGFGVNAAKRCNLATNNSPTDRL